MMNLDERINCEGALFTGINTIAMMARIELFVDEERWRSSSKDTQMLLYSLITKGEEKLVDVVKEWNHHRTKICKLQI